MEENKTDKNIEKEIEQLNTYSTDETSMPAETIPEVEKPITHNLSAEALAKVDPKPETSNDMEVHHHSHESHGKKNWKSYFCEFLMLFLAVFCGFLAEYQLEHKIEQDREKVFASSLYEDLKKDTITLNSAIPFWESMVKRIDTIRIEVEKPATSRNTLLLYKLIAKMRFYSNFEYHDRTIEQLKNGGNFRLIRKIAVSDSLIDYDAIIKSRIRDIESQSGVIYQTLNFLQDKLINSKYFILSYAQNSGRLDSIFKVSPSTFEIVSGKESELFEYYNHLQFYKIMTQGRLMRNKELLLKATNLMELLQKEYHLE
jgi:hypothetical protein